MLLTRTRTKRSSRSSPKNLRRQSQRQTRKAPKRKRKSSQRQIQLSKSKRKGKHKKRQKRRSQMMMRRRTSQTGLRPTYRQLQISKKSLMLGQISDSILSSSG